MPNEASKTRRIWNADVWALLRGRGLDIGCGADPVLPEVECFDKPQGDANHLSRYVVGPYDFAFASHVLEHMDDPAASLKDWLRVIRPGGHLIVLVPDEDLYEQGVFPSIFNSDHKYTFTISKAQSWSPRSLNVIDLCRTLPAELISVELQDHGYDRRLMRHSPNRRQLRQLTIHRRLLRSNLFRPLALILARLLSITGTPVDQTAMPDHRLAQIQFILRRPVRL